MSVPLLSGPFDVGQLQNTLNMLINQVNILINQIPSGSGDVIGPDTSTPDSVVLWDNSAGTLTKSSAVTIDDEGNVTANSFSGLTTAGGSVTALAQSSAFFVPLPSNTLLEYLNIVETAGVALPDSLQILFYPAQPETADFVNPIVVNGCTDSTALTNVTYDNGVDGVGATLTHNVSGVISIDGGATAGNIVAVTAQADATQNGVYTITQIGTSGTRWVLTRTPGADVGSFFKQGNFFTTSAGGQPQVQVSASSPILGTDPITYSDGTDFETSFQINGNDIIAVDCRGPSGLPGIFPQAINLCDPVNNGMIAMFNPDMTASTGADFAGAVINFTACYSIFMGS